MRFGTGQFKGQVPLLVPHLLKPEYSTFSLDCALNRMALRPSYEPLATGFTFDQEPKTIYPHYTVPLESSPGLETGVFDGWFWFPYKTTAFFSVLPNDQHDRIYFLDENGRPRITDHDNITLFNPDGTGGPATPSVDNDWRLGVPAPSAVPTGTPAGGGSSAVVEDRAYVFTYVDYWGAEGPPSPPSQIVVTVKQDDTVTVGNLVSSSNPDYRLTGGKAKKRIYRAVSGTTRTDYLYVGEIDATETSFVDDAPPEKLGEVVPTRTWYEPPDKMEGWVMAPNGALVGWNNNTIYMSMPYLPSAWPPDYQIAINHDIKGMAAIAGSVAIMTNNNPYVLSGVIPMSAQARKLDLEEGCVNEDSIVAIGQQALYASPNGITVVSQGDAAIMTAELLSRRQWEKFAAETATAINYQDSYLMFYDATGHPDTDAAYIYDGGDYIAPVKGAFNLEGREYLQFWSDYFETLVTRPHDERVFGAAQNESAVWELHELDPTPEVGGVVRPFTWRSKLALQTKPVNFACGQIEARAYPVIVTVWADNKRVYHQKISDRDIFRLPGGFKARDWEVEMTGEHEVMAFVLAESVMEMAEV